VHQGDKRITEAPDRRPRLAYNLLMILELMRLPRNPTAFVCHR
jgi:hypothetical protein